MSGKRFRPVSCVTDWYIEDMKTSPFAVLTPHQVSDLLNEFYEDLTTKKEDAEYELLHLKEKYEELLGENEQLKQQLAERERMLDVRDKIIADVMKAVNGDVE